MALLMKADGSHENVHPANGSDFSLEELYELLHCQTIETIYCADGLMIFDEEAKMRRKRVNHTATLLLDKAGGIPGDVIAGDCLLCKDSELL